MLLISFIHTTLCLRAVYKFKAKNYKLRHDNLVSYLSTRPIKCQWYFADILSNIGFITKTL